MALQISHIHKHIGSQQILKDISLSMQEGEVIGLLGPNGAGKSTLMKIMVGVWEADGNPMLTVPESIGYLPEQNPLYEEMYVREYLLFFMQLRGVKAKDRNAQLKALIEQVGLTDQAYKRISELSKGYRQRVGLAQALIGNPKLLILDEPTTGLDPNQLEDIRSLIRSAGKNRMIILSTHILQEVSAMCTRVVIIDHGEIKADQPMSSMADAAALEELFHSSTHCHSTICL